MLTRGASECDVMLPTHGPMRLNTWSSLWGFLIAFHDWTVSIEHLLLARMLVDAGAEREWADAAGRLRSPATCTVRVAALRPGAQSTAHFMTHFEKNPQVVLLP